MAAKRILLLGAGGAGKTTFAIKLGAKTGLPIIHLDAFYWKPGWVEPDKAIWREQLTQLSRQESWIMDGNYSDSLDIRLPRADLVIFFNIPNWRCLLNVLKRRFQYAPGSKKDRPGMAPGCPEKIDFEFMTWVWMFPWKNKPKVMNAIRQWKNPETPFVIFDSYAAADQFLKEN